MSKKLAMTPTIKTSNFSKPEKVACPKCDASLIFYRSDKPHTTSVVSRAIAQNAGRNGFMSEQQKLFRFSPAVYRQYANDFAAKLHRAWPPN
jgi:hypothetical protein